MQIRESVHQTLNQLENILYQLSDHEYTQTVALINEQTIGKHVRHIIEFFECLIKAKNVVCFDDREREIFIENSTKHALNIIHQIKNEIEILDFNAPIILRQIIGIETLEVSSTRGRELVYCIDHCIHHFAIIKMVLKSDFPNISIDNDFGIAYSTLNYNMQK